MQYFDHFAIIALAAAIHASFQLSVSMLTVMSGHRLGKRTSHGRLMRLAGSFITGAAIMVALILSFTIVIAQNIMPVVPQLVWAATAGLCVGIGVAVWLFYYRHRRSGTVLWLPRPIARFLESRAKETTSSAEAFSLGLASIIGELIFSLAPIVVAALVLLQLPSPYQVGGLALYSLVAILPVLTIFVLIGSGHSLAKIQRWRETNKLFLQFIAGSALIIMGVLLYVDTVFGNVIILGREFL